VWRVVGARFNPPRAASQAAGRSCCRWHRARELRNRWLGVQLDTDQAKGRDSMLQKTIRPGVLLPPVLASLLLSACSPRQKHGNRTGAETSPTPGVEVSVATSPTIRSTVQGLPTTGPSPEPVLTALPDAECRIDEGAEAHFSAEGFSREIAPEGYEGLAVARLCKEFNGSWTCLGTYSYDATATNAISALTIQAEGATASDVDRTREFLRLFLEFVLCRPGSVEQALELRAQSLEWMEAEGQNNRVNWLLADEYGLQGHILTVTEPEVATIVDLREVD